MKKKIATVSQVLNVIDKPGLVYWANKIGLQGKTTKQALKESAGVGTTLHYMAECYVLGKEYGELHIDERDRHKIILDKCFGLEENLNHFKQWWYNNGFTDPETEVYLESKKLMFRGRLDIIADRGDSTLVIDIKTAKAIYDNHKFQVAGYYLLALEDGYDVTGGAVVQIGRTPWESPHVWEADKKILKPYIEVFKRARDLFYALESVKT